MRASWLIVAVVAIGCGGGKSDKPADPPPAKGSANSGSAVAKPADKGSADKPVAAKAADPPKKKSPTKQQLADYAKHVRAGWAKQKTSEWAAAVTEFEAALVAIDSDPRALGELGYSAMLAGDFAKAKKIDQQAIAVAIDPKVQAMGLYNLGVVQEKTGDKAGALASFVRSLQLRPNATVEKEVGKLGAKPPVADAPWCAAGKKACDCVQDDTWGDYGSDARPACQESTEPVPGGLAGFHVYETGDDYRSASVLLDEHGQLVAHVGGGVDHGHVFSDTKVTKADVKTVGAHKVLWLETTSTVDTVGGASEDPRVMMTENNDTTIAVTLCVIGDAKTPTTCPLREVARSQIRDSVDSGDKDANDHVPEIAHRHSETKVDISLADDGTATVKLVSGALDTVEQGLVGVHKLW